MAMSDPATSADPGAALLAWAVREGATISGCRVGVSPCGGRGVFASRTLQSGEEVFRCPTKLLLRAADALAEPTIGAALREVRGSVDCGHLLDDRALMLLLLVRSRALGEASPWAAYLACLPPPAELAASLPLSWTADELAALEGTALLHQAREQRRALERLYEAVVVRVLQPRWPSAFPAATFDWDALVWAHAAFWSRAIGLELPGGREECLVPLLDMCNHTPGARAARVVPWCRAHSTRGVARRPAMRAPHRQRADPQLAGPMLRAAAPRLPDRAED